MTEDPLARICRELRKTGFKPYARMYLNWRKVELISYPWYERGEVLINVREPGDPTTMVTVPTNALTRHWFAPSWGLGTIGARFGAFYFDVFVRPYFGLFTSRPGVRTWRKLPTFKLLRRRVWTAGDVCRSESRRREQP